MEDTLKAEKLNFWKIFVRFQNPLMKALLQSPLHGIVSQWYLLITVRGRKSGQIYTTPVQYHQVGNQLSIISSKSYRWWRNIGEGAELSLYLRGKAHQGFGRIYSDKATIEETYRLLYPQMNPAMREKMLDESIVIHVDLKPS